MSELKAYLCHVDGNGYEESAADIVFALNAKEAKRISWNKGCCAEMAREHAFNNGGNPYHYVKVHRKKLYDKFIKKDTPYIASTDVYRQLGWMVEDDNMCGTCELYEMDKAKEEYIVCENCENCGVCGCLETCGEKEQSENDPRISN